MPPRYEQPTYDPDDYTDPAAHLGEQGTTPTPTPESPTSPTGTPPKETVDYDPDAGRD